jgi:flagellar biosynthesis/type III secretory pathway M-ring protein FliF/YscJ
LEQPQTTEAAAPPSAVYPITSVPVTAEITEISKAPEIKHEIIVPAAPTREIQPTKEVAIVQIGQKIIQTPEEKALSRLKAKEEFENRLSSKAQMLVNKFFPPNSILVKVNVDLEEYRFEQPPKKILLKTDKRIYGKKVILKSKPAKPVLKFGAITPENIRRMTIIVLIDNRFNLTPALKKTTLETIKNVLSYHPARGDTIIIRQVPFHYATAAQTSILSRQNIGKETAAGSLTNMFNWFLIWNKIVLILGILLLAIVVIIFARRIFGKRRKDEVFGFEKERYARPSPFEGKAPAIDQIRASVAESPEKVAELIKKWLTEE